MYPGKKKYPKKIEIVRANYIKPEQTGSWRLRGLSQLVWWAGGGWRGQ